MDRESLKKEYDPFLRMQLWAHYLVLMLLCCNSVWQLFFKSHGYTHPGKHIAW